MHRVLRAAGASIAVTSTVDEKWEYAETRGQVKAWAALLGVRAASLPSTRSLVSNATQAAQHAANLLPFSLVSLTEQSHMIESRSLNTRALQRFALTSVYGSIWRLEAHMDSRESVSMYTVHTVCL